MQCATKLGHCLLTPLASGTLNSDLDSSVCVFVKITTIQSDKKNRHKGLHRQQRHRHTYSQIVKHMPFIIAFASKSKTQNRDTGW